MILENKRLWSCLLLLCFCALHAQETHQPGATASRAAGANDDGATIRITMPDVILTDQDGHTLHFNALVQDKIAVINTVFTTCSTICPMMGANFNTVTKAARPARR
jgi:cytochrome oxidase Cu insertion factor (SCO1/SenC/PrrC family)